MKPLKSKSSNYTFSSRLSRIVCYLFDCFVVGMNEEENIQVAVRCRPLSDSEITSKHASIVEVFPNERAISLQSLATNGNIR